ncbi:methylenetetrahydrofolate reductase [NAD(P)H] [Dongia sp.]|uniref:methylenetetrahydrofolate reductase [NAD(P)H] n=1 Tax=Dongia sp. TaxID=1977262 RepID=UPI0035AF73CF
MIESQGPKYPARRTDLTDRPGRASDLAVSFEFFPPRQAELLPAFWDAAADLATLAPRFVSVTYGAGGSTRDQTRELVTEIQARCQVPAAAHLTCVGGARAETDAIADAYWRAGIHRLVALRGDPREGIAAGYRPHPDGYAYADSLVAGLARLHPFDISVAAYPEVHPQALSAQADLDHLKRKVDAGATRAITQFFFDVDCYKRFLERATRAGINVPIVPGILPIRNFARTVTMAQACGAHIPAHIGSRFEALADDADGRLQFAQEIALGQCRALLRAGVRHFHFYTLNQGEMVRDICAELGLVSPLAGYR